MHLKMSSVKWQTFFQGGDELYKTSGPRHSYTTIVSITYVIAKHHKNIQFYVYHILSLAWYDMLELL